MGVGDPIYKTSTGEPAYKSGDGRPAYKKVVSAVYGNVVNWTQNGGLWSYEGHDVFQAPVALNYLIGTSPWYWRRNNNISGPTWTPHPPRIWAWWESNYWRVKWTGQYGEEIAYYRLADTTVPTYPSYPLVGTYTRVSDWDFGTVTISAA